MAGRNPRPPRDERDGATPLTGVPAGKKKRKPYVKRDPYYPAEWAIGERTARFLRDVLASTDYPDHLRSPMFGRALQAWARAEVIADMIYGWMGELAGIQGPAALMLPPMPGTKALIETYQTSERRAEQARKSLGLDPSSYAKLMKDAGLTRKAEDAALETLDAGGAEIVARREIEGAG